MRRGRWWAWLSCKPSRSYRFGLSMQKQTHSVFLDNQLRRTWLQLQTCAERFSHALLLVITAQQVKWADSGAGQFNCLGTLAHCGRGKRKWNCRNHYTLHFIIIAYFVSALSKQSAHRPSSKSTSSRKITKPLNQTWAQESDAWGEIDRNFIPHNWVSKRKGEESERIK